MLFCFMGLWVLCGLCSLVVICLFVVDCSLWTCLVVGVFWCWCCFFWFGYVVFVGLWLFFCGFVFWVGEWFVGGLLCVLFGGDFSVGVVV